MADIDNAESLKAAPEAAKNQFGAIHIVVNNAGGPMRRMDRQITWPDADSTEDVNLKMIGMLRSTQAFLPLMPPDSTGRILNISGVASTLVIGTALTHGLNSAESGGSYLANDLAGDEITVNAVIPGLVGTERREVWAENMSKQQGKSKASFWRISAARWGSSPSAGNHGRGREHSGVSRVRPRPIHQRIATGDRRRDEHSPAARVIYCALPVEVRNDRREKG